MDFLMPMLSASARQGAADAGGVHQFHRNSTDGDGFADQVARGAGLGGDDGAFAFDQAIEEARLAYVGTTYDG